MNFRQHTLDRCLKLIFGSVIVGSLVGLLVPNILKLFTLDASFEFYELLLSFLIIIIILVLFVLFITNFLCRIITIRNTALLDFKFIQFRFLIIPGVLTCIFPMGGGLFGGTGNEPIGLFVLIGIGGSLFWSLPLILWLFIASLFRR